VALEGWYGRTRRFGLTGAPFLYGARAAVRGSLTGQNLVRRPTGRGGWLDAERATPRDAAPHRILKAWATSGRAGYIPNP
jgi:hypothetical protein